MNLPWMPDTHWQVIGKRDGHSGINFPLKPGVAPIIDTALRCLCAPFCSVAREHFRCNAMAGALATRLFGAEARSAARLRRTRRQTRMFEAQPSLRVCLAARALEGSRSAAQAAKVKRRRRPGHGIAGARDQHAPFDTSGRTALARRHWVGM